LISGLHEIEQEVIFCKDLARGAGSPIGADENQVDLIGRNAAPVVDYFDDDALFGRLLRRL
jgi:hypothetical protein